MPARRRHPTVLPGRWRLSSFDVWRLVFAPWTVDHHCAGIGLAFGALTVKDDKSMIDQHASLPLGGKVAKDPSDGAEAGLQNTLHAIE